MSTSLPHGEAPKQASAGAPADVARRFAADAAATPDPHAPDASMPPIPALPWRAMPENLRAFQLTDGEVLRNRVALLLSPIPLALLSSYLSAGMTAWLLHTLIPAWKLVTWLAFLGLAHVVRLIGWHDMRRPGRAPDLHGCLRRLRAGVLLTALAWTALPLFMFPRSVVGQLQLATIIAAICGAGASELASDARSASLFVVPTLVALLVRLLGSAVPGIQALGVMGAVFGLYLVKSAQKTERIFLHIAYLRAKAAERIHIDEITGLRNRSGLNQLLRETIARAAARGGLLAVGYIDLDDFKPVNDQHGHAAGDQILRALGQRLRQHLGGDGEAARISGDEFVVVLPRLDADYLQVTLDTVFERLHRAVEEPFHLDGGHTLRIDMTMGVALYPSQANDADGLLRTADAAMYQVKRRKGERASWWQLGVRQVGAAEVEQPVDPYGAEAALRMTQLGPVFERISDDFISAFYAMLADDAEALSILRSLGETGTERLRGAQAAHLRRLADPELDRQTLREASRRIGRAHALVGVNTRMLVKSSSLFRSILSSKIAGERLVARRRLRMFQIIDARLQDDLEQQVSMLEETNRAYMAYLSRPGSDRQSLWADAAHAELQALDTLPGIVMVTLSRLNLEGEIIVEHSAGVLSLELGQRLSHGDLRASIDPNAPGGQTPTAVAWRTQEIHRVDSCLHDPRMQHPQMQAWREMAEACAIHSNVSIPFVGRDRHVEGVLTLYGAYPRQFASEWVQQWAGAVQRRMESIWLGSTSVQHMAISQARAVAFREILFSGGLEMFYQPIVDLQTGQVAKLEALARLKMPDGTIIGPAGFIPLLGGNELGRVFREGLRQSLADLRRWSEQGLQLGVALNLPPSVLSDVDCAAWIDQALRAHAIEPRRLTLELLEVQLDDDVAQAEEMDRLRALGVHLAMDDFGAGYSNIHRLSSIRFEAIKIDQNLTRQFRQSPLETTTMLGTLIRLVRELGRDVTVEGLEHLDSMEAAAVLGARFGQGYAIARPMPAHDVPEWVRHYRLPIDVRAGKLQTSLGALAFQWQHTGFGAGRHPLEPAQCPLHGFLHGVAGEHDDVQRWHAQVHDAGADASEASRRLMHWLAGRVPPGQPARGVPDGGAMQDLPACAAGT